MLTAACLAITALALNPEPDPDNGGLTLPEGFGAVVVHEGVGPARHIAVRENGDLYVALRRNRGGGIVCIRDEDGDFKADRVEKFGQVQGTGIAIRDNWLYFGGDFQIVRFELPEDSLTPVGDFERIVFGFVQEGQHAAKPIDFGADGKLYVNCGAPSNACQQLSRTPGSPGMDPCPLLEYCGGIWVYDPDTKDQEHPADGERFATGLRHCVAIDEHDGAIYTVMHGRDQLDTLFSEHFDNAQNAELPAEEMHRLTQDSNAGWPYTYWDGMKDERMVAPEYGGDGEQISDNDDFQDPIQAFPAHWAPNAIMIYEGEQFPERYRGGAFVAFHGSWNRAPFPQAGYKVTFTPMDGGEVAGDYEVFADGFAGSPEIRSPRDAQHRPMGLATAPDGSIYISDSVRGKIWRVFWVGEKE